MTQSTNAVKTTYDSGCDPQICPDLLKTAGVCWAEGPQVVQAEVGSHQSSGTASSIHLM